MIQIKIPAVGESITEATISQWMKKNGDVVRRDEILLTLETDKASVEVVAESAGRLSIKVNEGQTVAIGSVVGEIDETVSAGAAAPAAPAPSAAPTPSAPSKSATSSSGTADNAGPAVRKLVAETGVNTSQINGSGKDGRITKGDVLGALNNPTPAATPRPSAPVAAPSTANLARPAPRGSEEIRREPMSKLRQTIARRLVEAQHTAAILTTFNEIDMGHLMSLRSKYKDAFEKKHGVKLGFMGFFVKAAVEALRAFPRVNAYIEGNEMVFHSYNHVGIAVGTEKGLIVPVLRHAEMMSLADVELSIKGYAEKARQGKISVDDLSGGTFTISNGGVYGSLMSTPILNPPQSGILGLHKIEDRPMAIQGKVEIRPMMYVALSYDHRIIDGSEAVGFLVKIKECIEEPARLLLEI